MASLTDLAARMFPHVDKTPADYEILYPPRALPEGARVTRIAPSPTGYLHLGTLFTATINRLTADVSGGVFFFRLEDTDKKREIEGGAEDILEGLANYQVKIDEGFVAPDKVIGDYGPYQQSRRGAIYHAYVKDLVIKGLAYPCFCTAEDLNALRERQEAAKRRTGYYGADAVCRHLTPDEAIAKIDAGLPYVVRLRSEGDENRRVKFDDIIKGTIEMPENDQDIVLLKTDGIPTYHFAHAVDDHLMRTTHVIRGDEWISSVPIHLQLFKMLGFKPPKYAHISPIMKEENGNKRKLSKRKDPEAAVHYYAEQGYPADSVLEYLMTIANSDYEEWRKRNAGEPRSRFAFNLKKMNQSGALFDLDKLNDVSKNVIASMSAADITAAVRIWAKEYDPAFSAMIESNPDYLKGILAIDRDNPKPRKDIAKWNDVPAFAAYFYRETYQPDFELPESITKQDAAAVLNAYTLVYDPTQDKQAWFETVKSICAPLGFCPDTKLYRQDPSVYKGSVGDVSTMIRMAVTGRRNTPDLCSIMQLLGKEEVMRRLKETVDRIGKVD